MMVKGKASFYFIANTVTMPKILMLQKHRSSENEFLIKKSIYFLFYSLFKLNL